MSIAYKRRKKLLKRKQWDNSARLLRDARKKPIPQATMTTRMLNQVRGHY